MVILLLLCDASAVIGRPAAGTAAANAIVVVGAV
jgi:hypothetical protein